MAENHSIVQEKENSRILLIYQGVVGRKYANEMKQVQLPTPM